MSYPRWQAGLNNKRKGVHMTTLIHCHHCQEDMNAADWQANGEACLHCERPLSAAWPKPNRRFAPIVRLKHRLQLSEFVRSQPAYV